MTTVFDELFNNTSGVVDVRSPAEYAQGHIPGAVNIPIFDDAERAVVGTAYVQQGREQAIDLGLGIVGPKLVGLVEQARAIGKPLIVYCWRGGMRSAAMCWLLQTSGMHVLVVPRGYKGYRAHAMGVLSQQWLLRVVVGPTGSGKTEYLHALAQQGEQVLDLEAIACHKGSAFGMLGELPQPTTEHAFNLIHRDIAQFDISKPVWVEDESRLIGRVYLPEVLFEAMQKAELHVLDVSLETRIANLVRIYGGYPKQDLTDAFERLRKKLGGARCNQAIDAISEGDLDTAVGVALEYYDKTYAYCMTKRTREKP